LDNLNDREENCPVEDEFDIERGNGINHLEIAELPDVSAASNVFGVIWTTRELRR